VILRTLLSHYRRHPVQAIFLFVGILIANVLLTGTLLINAQARASYGEGEQLLDGGPQGRILPRNSGAFVDERDYLRLRLQGFATLAPVLSQVVRAESGEALELLGLDLFAMAGVGAGRSGDENTESDDSGRFAGFSFAPYELLVAPGRLQQLGWVEDERIPLQNGRQLPPVTAVEESELGHRLLLDIGALQELTDTAGSLSWIAVFPDSPERLAALKEALPPHLSYVDNAQAPDPAELTRSFHLNLAAMGLLSFVVGIFLVYNALAFSYTDRQALLRRMRLAGVTRFELRRGLLAELALFLVLGCLAGIWLGARLAAFLLPGVGRTLAQLYDVYITYPDALAPGGALLPVAMTVIAAALCVAFPMREALNAPLLERWQGGWLSRSVDRRDRLMRWMAALFLVLSLLGALFAQSLWQALAGMACLLLGAALLLPSVLRWLLSGLERLAPPRMPRLAWLLSDSRWLLGPASLALMAMTLALVANSGLNTMIGSFRVATADWLDQRLPADLYLRSEENLPAVQALLEKTYPELDVDARYRLALDAKTPQGGSVTVEVTSLPRGSRYEDAIRLLDGVEGAKARFRSGDGIYVSERAWRIEGWRPGQVVALCDGKPKVEVLGVYHDYGNPLPQWLAAEGLVRSCWPGLGPDSVAVSGSPKTDWAQVRRNLLESGLLAADQLIDQAELKGVGMAVFDRTFTVTRALNGLTLLVAAIGIFCAIAAIHHHRVSMQALLASLGVSARERGALLLAQWGLLGLLCMVLVWPFGILLAAYLSGVVTPAAFGWSFPLRPDGAHYLELALWAAGSLVLAVLLPTVRLLRASPAALLREIAA